MGTVENTENHQLANRLTSAADGISSKAASGLEQDLRTAAELIFEIQKPMPIVAKLSSEIAKIANACPDAATALRLRRLLGEV